MALFANKNKIEEYEDKEMDRESFRKKPKSKDFKDLKPENRKKRKEPKKPWGKSERIFVLFVIMLTVGVSGILALYSRSWKLSGLPRLSINFSSITPPFFGEDTIIIEGRREDKEISEKVIAEFEVLTKELSGVYGFYVVDLISGYYYGINEKEEFEPASLNKLPVMLGLYMEADDGVLDLGTKHKLDDSDKIPGSGSLYTKPTGTVLTYRDLIRYMAKESDNTAFSIARKILGQEKIENVIESLGMKNTVILGDSQKTTPEDIGVLFQRVWWGGLISDYSKDELLEFLTDTIYEDHLVAGLPSEIRVAHKYGRELHVVNDAGIVFSDKPYIVVIMSKGIIEKEADQIFPRLSELIFKAEVNKK